MRAAKSFGSLNGASNQQVQPAFNLSQQNGNGYQTTKPQSSKGFTSRPDSVVADKNNYNNPTSPICRCRVMYLGSSVPHITKDGLQGIQEPLRELYPDKIALASGNAGIDSWLSVWSNGILVENVDETGKEIKRFFKIESLHYCAAVKYVPLVQNPSSSTYETLSNIHTPSLPKFLPLDSPYARQLNPNPPIFASILRRTTGIKVLECHAFICKREAAANALVRCCFHAYADTMYAKQIDNNMSNGMSSDYNNNTSRSAHNTQYNSNNSTNAKADESLPMTKARSKSIANLNDVNTRRHDHIQEANEPANYSDHSQDNRQYRTSNTIVRQKSVNELQGINHENSKNFISDKDMLKKQGKLSKSMHHIDKIDSINVQQINDHDLYLMNHPAALYGSPNLYLPHHLPQPPFYSANAGRVPSYPPPNMVDTTSNGGTLKSIKSMAANSIASTLLRSKKHARAMSIAQLNNDHRVTSFHQPHSNASTMIGPMMIPPVSSLFLPNVSPRILNGSQTMKNPSRSAVPFMGAPVNFEALTHKEMKKILKKSAKYGIDASKFSENGLPLMPLRPPPVPPPSEPGALISPTVFADVHSDGMTDLGLHAPRLPFPPEPFDQVPVKPILVRPNPEFIKSKAGKKWLKQQREFKKLLPPHLDGLPIVFGPPPMDALEPTVMPKGGIQMPAFIPPPPIPLMDNSGYYNPHPFYGQNASTTSTLIRYSPHQQMLNDVVNGPVPNHLDMSFTQKSHSVYNTPIGASSMISSSKSRYVPDSRSVCGASNCPENGFRNKKRNHMVEQSIISLEDENDYDDEDDGHTSDDRYEIRRDYVPTSGHKLNKSEGKSNGTSRRDAKKIANCHEPGSYSNQGYEHVNSSNDDQSSYYSGIYKKEHINERAFLYSIKQEHRSENLMNDGYTSREELDPNYSNANAKYIDTDMPISVRNYPDNEISRQIQMNDLSNRMENQMIMNSFPSSKVKSQM